MRFIMYCGLGISAFIPVVHGILLRGWEIQNQRMALTYFTGLGVLNFCDAAIYAVRIPERWYPRRFDKYGGSHQLMDVLVVCGAISHSIGLVKTFGYWQQESRVGYEACNEGA
jgi:adiponectin receptor